MGNAKAQHQLVGAVVETYPELAVRLDELTGAEHPDYDQLVPTSNTHPMRSGAAIETDTTVSLLMGGNTRYFTQVEMQNEYEESKVATVRAYHGSQVRKSRCGGRVYVLSPRDLVAAQFRAEEERRRQEYALDVRYLSFADLSPMGTDGQPYPDRALAVALTDFKRVGLTDRAKDMLEEMGDQKDDLLADLLLRAILEECPDDEKLEEAMTDIAFERLNRLPTGRKWLERARAEGRAEARAEVAEARAEVEAARVDIKRDDLKDFFLAKGEILSPEALTAISKCADEAVLQNWLMRAYRGESSGELFAATGEYGYADPD
jgi:hypothetical protein